MQSSLELLVEDIRIALGDPAIGAQYTDAQLLRRASAAAQRVVQDVQRVSSRPIVAVADVIIPVGTTVYQLPPSIGTLLEIGEWDSTYGNWKGVYYDVSRSGPFRPGLHLSGRCIVLDKAQEANLELRIEYKPSGEFSAHEGSRNFNAAALGASEFALIEPSVAPVRGIVDDRQNAYVGALLRVWATTNTLMEVQERVVTAHTINTALTGKQRLLTVDVPFSPVLVQDAVATYEYEVVHSSLESVRECVVLLTALQLCTPNALSQKKNALALDYRIAVRGARLSETNADQRRQHWVKDTMRGVFGS